MYMHDMDKRLYNVLLEMFFFFKSIQMQCNK